MRFGATVQRPGAGGGLFAERPQVYASTMDEATREALGFGAQAAYAPQRITRHTGVEYLRCNRVEALSVGGALRQQLGAGWSWEANARGSLGDRQLNGELYATRANGRTDVTVAGHRRLVQADDYGQAFGLLASLQAAVAALDEQCYHRVAGAELTRRTSGRRYPATGLARQAAGCGECEWRHQQRCPAHASAVESRWLADGARVSVGGSVGICGLPMRLDAVRDLDLASRWHVNLDAPIRF